MAKVELRNDNWYDVGNDPTNPIIHMLYLDKQIIKRSLIELGERKEIRELEKAISGIRLEKLVGFGKIPYVRDNEIYIGCSGPTGNCYLGKIIE